MPDKKWLKKFTANFNEVKPVIIEYNTAKQKAHYWKRKLTTIESKYKFLIDVVGVNSNDIQLSSAVKLLFKNAGFKKVVHFKDKKAKVKREDLQIWTDTDLFIIEVKGISQSVPKNSDLHQLLPYVAEAKNRNSDKNIYGLVIINHDNKREPRERQQTFKNHEKEKDAVNLKFGFMSTMDLVIAFMLLKQDKLTFEEFKESLKQYGLITYDSKGG